MLKPIQRIMKYPLLLQVSTYIDLFIDWLIDGYLLYLFQFILVDSQT